MPFGPTDLRAAIENGEFVPYFQPFIEMRTGQMTGVEVLARWNHPRLGIVLPGGFLLDIETAGLIEKLTRSILERVFSCRALVESALGVSVNISPHQLLDLKNPGRLATVERLIGFPLSRLTIEVTESALVDDLPRAQTVARQIKALGCRLALDDFGTGYSSLKHLHALPFDELKVDQSFIGYMVERRESRKIVASVIGLGQSLGLRTVAEGVETQEQADLLFRMGCDVAQGYLFGRPMPADDLAALISSGARVLAVKHPAALDESDLSLTGPPGQRLAQLQAIYDGAPVGLCLLDHNLRYVSINSRLADMNGLPAVAHIGKSPADTVPGVFRLVEPYLRRALAGEALRGVEVEKSAPGDESSQNLLCSYQPVRDEAGEVLGVSVAVMDNSEHKRIEDALSESEEHFRNMMKLSPGVPWVLNTRGEVIEASPRWESITGQPLSEAMRNGWRQMLHPEDLAWTDEAIRNALENGQPIDIRYRVRTPDGEWLWMRSRGAPRLGPTGKVICVYGVVEEIEDQGTPPTQALIDCLSQLRAALDTIPYGIVIAEAGNGTVLEVNPSARQIFGGAIFPGQKLGEYGTWGVARLDGAMLRAGEYPLAKAIFGIECVEPSRYLLKAPDGTTTHLSLSAKPLHADDGQLIGGIMAIRSAPHGRII